MVYWGPPILGNYHIGVDEGYVGVIYGCRGWLLYSGYQHGFHALNVLWPGHPLVDKSSVGSSEDFRGLSGSSCFQTEGS